MEESTTYNEPGIEEVAELLEEELIAAREELERLEHERQQALDGLAAKITKSYLDRSSRRSAKEARWAAAERAYLGSLANESSFYGDNPFEPKSRARRPDRNIVFTKCEIAKAHIMSMQFAGDEKNFELLPPSTGGAPDADERVRKMESTIADQLEACNYKAEVGRAIHQLVVLGTGILKGPVNIGRPRKRFVENIDEMGQSFWTPQVVVDRVPEIKWVNLWFAFPDDSVTDIHAGEDFIELHPMSRTDLSALRNNPAYIRSAIEEVLVTKPDDFLTDSTDFTSVTDSNPNALRNKYRVLEYHGPITQTQLNALDIEAPYEVPEGQEYYGEVWVCNNKVLRLELENIEGYCRPPYSGDVWQKDPSSPFGFGVAEKLMDSQRVVTQTWHMILDNASASSAPQVVINEDAIDPRNGEYEIAPGKIWYFTNISGNVSDAFQYFETPNVQQQLFPVLEAAKASGEEESGISLMTAGLQSPEVGSDTATGQAIVSRAATVLLDEKSDSWDRNCVEPRIKCMYDWNMQYNPDPSIKMDMEVRVKLATTYRNKQLYIRDMEKLSVEMANNPLMAQHIRPDSLIRARLAAMNMPSQDILKSQEEVEYERQQAAENPPPPPPEALRYEIDKARLEIDRMRLDLEARRLDFESTANQQRELWEHQERMVNSYARITEAESQVLKVQTEKEIALANLAAKMESEQDKNRLTMGMKLLSDQTSRFLANQKSQEKERDQLLTVREMELKKQYGTGI